MHIKRRGAVVVSTLVALLAGAAPALADTATLSFQDAGGNSDPAQGLGRALVVTGNTTAAKRVWIRYRAAGGAPCAPSAYADSGSEYHLLSAFNGDQINGARVNGDFTLRRTGAWGEAGTYMFCIWLSDTADAVSTPIRQDITFRAPTGTVSGGVAPVSPQVGQVATVTITGSSEAPKRVYATYRAAGGAPCAISYSADSGRALVTGTSVNGPFSLTETLTPSEGGSYMICLWLAEAGDDSAPVAGPQTATFTVPTPCVVPRISAGATLASVRSRLTAAHCAVGAISRRSSTTVKSGRLIRLGANGGAQLAPGAAVSIVLSTGRPCVVPASRAGLTLSRAKARLKAAGCTPGKVTRVRSARRRGTVVSFSPRAGRTLASRATVAIRVSRGRR